MRGRLKSKTLMFSAVVILLLTGLSPVYAGYSFSESKAMEFKTAETTNVDIRSALDGESFLDRYDSSELEECHDDHPYFNRHHQYNPIRKPTIIDGEEWDIVVPDDYDTIQEAVDYADMGYRILVRAGTYEENVEIDVPLIILHGEDRDTAVIDGNGNSNVVIITDSADGVNVSGFTMQNSGNEYAGINVSSNYNILQDNIITYNGVGIQLYYSSGNHIQDNKIIDNNGDGLWLHRSNGNSIIENVISECGDNGIEFTYYSLGTTIENNTISDNSYCGILLTESSLGNIIIQNSITDNDFGVRCIGVSDGNIFYHNCFISNTQNAYDSSMDRWDYYGIGNFWDDYTGIDANGNGIGDTPYLISGGDNVDRFPLMNPVMIYEDLERTAGQRGNSGFDNSMASTVCSFSDDGWDIIVPDDYPIIQEAINHSEAGYRILVREGVYKENVLIDRPSLTLHGEDKETTIIDGGGNGHVVFVSEVADGLNISGFTIQSNGKHFTGLYLYSDSTFVEDVIFHDCNIGVALRDNSGNLVRDCEFEGNNFGIWPWMCTNTLFEDNVIENNSLDGMALQWSTNISFTGGCIEDNSFNGVLQISCSEIDIENNSIKFNGQFGIQLLSSENNIIKENDVMWHYSHEDDIQYCLHGTGISLHNSINNNITQNLISDNEIAGISLWFYSNNNTIYMNDIESTTKTNQIQGIWLFQSNDNTLIGNRLTSNGWGIWISDSHFNKMNENIITNNMFAGIFAKSNNNTISGNLLSNNIAGICLAESNNNMVASNNILKSFFLGLVLDSCDHNHITRNTISKNIAGGIFFKESHYNDIDYNTVSFSSTGIEIEHSTDNRISQNNLICNLKSGDFVGDPNTWDENYWNRPRLFPKPIFGKTKIGLSSLTFDWHPAQEPIEIGGKII